MQKKYKIGLIVIIALISVVILIGIISLFMKPESEPKEKNITNIISNIEEYGYTLDDRDTKYMEEVFKDLEETLEQEEVNYEEYATNLAKLFVIDFYTLNNKINKYDVGSLEYILSDKIEDFKTKAMDTIYSDIIDNTYKDRVQELPEITSVEVLNVETTEITLNENLVESYKVTMEYTYKKDLGYDTLGTIYFIKNKNKLEVALYEPKIEEQTKPSE